MDVCEIGELVGYTGQIKQVKVLGVMALLDEEETDWKIIVIDVRSKPKFLRVLDPNKNPSRSTTHWPPN